MAKPAANVTACCSAIPTSKVLLGNSLRKISRPVPSGIAAVIATILLSFLACWTKVLANTLVYDGNLLVLLTCSPVLTLNFDTPW